MPAITQLGQDQQERYQERPDVSVFLSHSDAEFHEYCIHKEITNDYGEKQQVSETIANFRIDVKAFLKDEDNQYMIEAEIIPNSDADHSVEVTLDMSVFNDVRKFKNNVCITKTTTFDGSAHHLGEIKQLVGHQDAPTKEIAKTVGMHGDSMVTPNGVIGEDGWVANEDSEYVYAPEVEGSISTSWDIDSDESFDYDQTEVQNYLRDVWRTRDPDKLLPLIGFIYGSLYAGQIRDMEPEYPGLNIHGQSNAGKSKAVEICLKGIGLNGKGNSPESSKASIRNTLTSTQNIPMWYDEFMPSRLEDWKVKTFKQYVKKISSLEEKEIGTQDQKNITFTFQSPIIITGEQVISGESDNRRMMSLEFTKSDQTEETTRRFTRLFGGIIDAENEEDREEFSGVDMRENAKAIWPYILKNQDNVEEMWNAEKGRVMNMKYENDFENVEDTEFTALVLSKFGLRVFREYAQSVGVDDEDLPTDQDIEDAITYAASMMGEVQRQSHFDEFIGLVGEAIKNGYIPESTEMENNSGAFKLVNRNQDDEQLRLKIGEAHSMVSKYIRDHDLNVDLLKKKDYKNRRKNVEDIEYVIDYGVRTPPLARCTAIDTHIAEQVVEGFERSQVNPEATNNVDTTQFE